MSLLKRLETSEGPGMETKLIQQADGKAASGAMDPDGPTQSALADLEQTIERLGMRHIADLRELSEKLLRLYSEQLNEKEARIVELTRRAETAERERDALVAHLGACAQMIAEQVSTLERLQETRREIAEIRALREAVEQECAVSRSTMAGAQA